jgi:hypothetical protein
MPPQKPARLSPTSAITPSSTARYIANPFDEITPSLSVLQGDESSYLWFDTITPHCVHLVATLVYDLVIFSYANRWTMSVDGPNHWRIHRVELRPAAAAAFINLDYESPKTA